MAERRPGLRTPPTPPELRLHVLMGEVLRRFGNYMFRVAELGLRVERLLAWRDELTGGTGGGMSGHQLGQKPWAEPEAGTVPEPQPGRSAPAAARGDAVTSRASSPLGTFCQAQPPEPVDAKQATTCACSGHCYQPGHRYRSGCNETLIVAYSTYCVSCTETHHRTESYMIPCPRPSHNHNHNCNSNRTAIAITSITIKSITIANHNRSRDWVANLGRDRAQRESLVSGDQVSSVLAATLARSVKSRVFVGERVINR